jgi:hypothetical protein
MIKKRLPLLLLFVLFLIAACSTGADDTNSLTDGYTFKSIDEIIDQELEVTNFAGDGSATLPIQTSIPVACTVVYGTTPEFGSLSLDQDMAGGAHSDHSPLLSGIEPETEYYFRVQGVDDDGIVYLSDVMTFTTPELEESESTNLASSGLGSVIVGFSSAFGGADLLDRWGAGGAFDDNPNTEWSSAGDGDEAWVEIKLAKRAQIDSVAFQSRAMNDGSAITKSFTITTGEGDEYGPYDLPDAGGAYTFDTAIEAQIIRFALTETTGGNTGVVDIAVYGQFIDK